MSSSASATVTVAGIAVGVAFVSRQRRLEARCSTCTYSPTVPASLTLGLLIGAAMGGASLLVSLYLQKVANLSPQQAGLWQLPAVLAMITISNVAPGLAGRFHPGIIAGGLAGLIAPSGSLTCS